MEKAIIHVYGGPRHAGSISNTGWVNSPCMPIHVFACKDGYRQATLEHYISKSVAISFTRWEAGNLPDQEGKKKINDIMSHWR